LEVVDVDKELAMAYALADKCGATSLEKFDMAERWLLKRAVWCLKFDMKGRCNEITAAVQVVRFDRARYMRLRLDSIEGEVREVG
jgi:hypothetical protein